MKIALIKRISRKKTTPLQDISPIIKKTCHIKTTEKVPNFADRWRAIRKHFTNPDNKQTKEKCKTGQNTRTILPAHSQEIGPSINPQKTKAKVSTFQVT
jgi:hypothetical protein